ncbi:hypothetical protein F5B19DRAFT_249273 [Rostrohypoxylon terebratum]|nr:hypothetical protein F5B19DRAFT_249273 [Rostrohypoxylon terebratum]
MARPELESLPKQTVVLEQNVSTGPEGRDPSITLKYILNFLTDEDQYRYQEWKPRLQLIKKYLREAEKALDAGELGYEQRRVRAMLKDALIIVDVHERIGKRSDGPTPWSTAKLSSQPSSKRLPSSLDQFLQADSGKPRFKRRRIDYPSSFSNHRKADIGGSTSPFAIGTRGGTNLIDFLISDEELFFENALVPQGSFSSVNLFKLDNDRYELCLKGGLKETLKRIPWRSPNVIPDIGKFQTTTQGTQRPIYTSTDNIQEFAISRGWQRAAIQQCMNAFSSYENRIVNTPWRRVVLPFTEPLPMPKELVYYPRALAPEKVHHSLKDPYSFIHQYGKYNELMNVLGSWTRRRYNDENMPEFQRSALPDNFIGPYVYHGLSVYDSHWLKIGSYLKRLRVLLQDAFGMAPRSFMLSILRDIEAGIGFDPLQTDPKYNRNDCMRRIGVDVVNTPASESSGTAQSHLQLLDEADAAWLRFLCEPSRTAKMCDPDQQPEDNLSILFINRLQNFLEDPNASGSPGVTGAGDIFNPDTEAWGRHQSSLIPTLEQALAYINGGGSVDTNETYQFSRVEAEIYLQRAAYFGRCQYIPADANNDTIIIRPAYELHPEHRIAWRHENKQALDSYNTSYKQTLVDYLTGVYNLKRRYASPNQFTHILDHVGDRELPFLLARATSSGDPEKEAREVLSRQIHDEYLRGRGSYPENGRARRRQEPMWEDLASWNLLGRVQRRKKTRLPVPEKTAQFFRNLAYRMGRTIAHAEEIERRLQISDPTGTSRWKAISRTAFNNDYNYWRESIRRGTGEIPFKQPTIQRVLEMADPNREFQSQFDKDKTSDWDILREGMINECVLNRNTLYPGRKAIIEDSSGHYNNNGEWVRGQMFQGVKRPSLWKWATNAQRRYQAPFTRYAFFSMMRWPVENQRGPWKQFLTSRQDEIKRINPRHPGQAYGILAPRIPILVTRQAFQGSKGDNSQESGSWTEGTKDTASDQ